MIGLQISDHWNTLFFPVKLQYVSLEDVLVRRDNVINPGTYRRRVIRDALETVCEYYQTEIFFKDKQHGNARPGTDCEPLHSMAACDLVVGAAGHDGEGQKRQALRQFWKKRSSGIRSTYVPASTCIIRQSYGVTSIHPESRGRWVELLGECLSVCLNSARI